MVGSAGVGAGNVLPANSTVTMSAGGYLNALSNETIGPLTGSGGTVNIGGGALTINSISNSTYSGTLQGGGGITKAGSGTLTLSGQDTYTGPTTVAAGRLFLNAVTLPSSGVTVQSGGTLGGNGSTVQGIVNLSGGHVAPGTPSNGVTFTPGSLSTLTASLQAGSLLDIKALNNGSNNDQLLVTGSNGLSLGNGAQVDLYAQDGASTFNPGAGLYTFNIIGYSGAIQGYGVYGLSVANPNPGTRYLFGTTGSYVTLKAGDFPQWSGSGSTANWSDSATGVAWASTPVINWSSTAACGPPPTTTRRRTSSYNGMIFNPTAASFTLTGNGITNTGDILNSSPILQTINLPMVMNKPGGVTFIAPIGPIATGTSATIDNGGQPLTIVGTANVTLGGSISGGGPWP